MGVPFIFVGVRQQNGCFDTHAFIQFSTYVPGCPFRLFTFGGLTKKELSCDTGVLIIVL